MVDDLKLASPVQIASNSTNKHTSEETVTEQVYSLDESALSKKNYQHPTVVVSSNEVQKDSRTKTLWFTPYEDDDIQAIMNNTEVDNVEASKKNIVDNTQCIIVIPDADEEKTKTGSKWLSKITLVILGSLLLLYLITSIELYVVYKKTSSLETFPMFYSLIGYTLPLSIMITILYILYLFKMMSESSSNQRALWVGIWAIVYIFKTATTIYITGILCNKIAAAKITIPEQTKLQTIFQNCCARDCPINSISCTSLYIAHLDRFKQISIVHSVLMLILQFSVVVLSFIIIFLP